MGAQPIQGVRVPLAGGWTDGTCDYCDQVTGSYILSLHDEFSCFWYYLEEEVCYTDSSIRLYIAVGFELSGTLVRIGVWVQLKTYSDQSRSEQIWYSSWFNQCENCFPRTVTSAGSTHVAGNCTGNFSLSLVISAA